ncbi:PREDICTED: uncharacterized protein LOC109184614 isoform X4 [Ipomoea nil]|uniref:uncharacterized protein LOC109184614 isoform X4 n=1 Tax=Ipomoea nil TaxID=35883 RepID=UPI000900887F|nr:PREDICTED: uncharacterized protein LOC109184614 isoform X4 [Ipomoea nil]
MSGKGSLNNGGGGVGMIPAGSRKMVESLKEIVSNYSDYEIYAVLKECNMDPNEAVNRLLSQDPFHEVKSKREKRKENKDTSEPRSRGGSSSSRGGRGGADRYGGRGSSESTLHGKFTSASKKENGSSTSLATGIAGSNMNLRPTATSGFIASENKKLVAVTTDHISSAPHPSAGHQPAWGGVPGQISMADIVKMGRPHNKAQNSTTASQQNANADYNDGRRPSYHVSHHNFQFPDDQASKVSEVHMDQGVCSAQHDSSNDEWPLIEQPSASVLPSISEPSADPDSSNLVYDRINQHLQVDEVQGTEDHGLSVGASHVQSGSVPNRKFPEDDSRGESLYENDIDIYRHKDHDHSSTHWESEFTVDDVNASVSSATENLQQLSVHQDQGVPPEEEGPSVVIPDHLQVQSADCSHLSFGSFGSGIGSALSGPSASAPVKNHVEEVPTDAEDPPMGHLTTRSSEYYGGETNPPDGNLFHRTGVSGTYESPAAPQPDSLKVEHSEVGRANQYSFPSSEPSYNYENAQQLNVEFSQPQTSSPVQNLAPFNAMGYTNSLPSNLLAANAHALRESDISYSIFPSTQAMPSKYGNSVSSVGGSSISMPEALKSGGLSSAQPTQQTLNGTGVATGPTLPQHLNLHPYSQPTVPLGPFTNMIGYPPFMPQNYTYVPSAFQQTFAGNSAAYHQSLAAMLPQYKASVSVSSLPQSAGVASGYGAFGNTTAIPGNFQMNTPAAPSATSLGYDDSPISQYKDNSHLMSLQQQQSENSATWLHGPGSRTMSAVPANTYYSYQGQHQQPGGFRQAQQPSQNYGSLSYNPNFYHSHTGISLDHQQQNPRDGSLGGTQGQPKQSQQIWQNNY